nr:L-rhamnose mutarotase [Peterkaempfera griseoplana]
MVRRAAPTAARGRVDEYRGHDEVWPQVLAAVSAAGWHNYALFLREDRLLAEFLRRT